MAPGRSDCLCSSFRQRSLIGLLPKLLLSLSKVLWSRWETMSIMASSFASTLSSTTSTRVTSFELTTDSAFYYEFIQSVCVIRFDALMPGHHNNEDGARKSRLIKQQEHLVADNKGPEPPQEVQLAQALLVDCLLVVVMDAHNTNSAVIYMT